MLNLRPYRESDAGQVGRLIADTYSRFNLAFASGDELGKLLGPFRHAWSDEPAHREAVAQVIRAPIVFVAEEDGEIVGVLRGRRERLASLFVRGDRHRQGIGRRLVEAFEKASIAEGVAAIRVASTLYAVPFYTALGYRRTTGIRNGWSFEGSGLRYQPMKKALPDAVTFWNLRDARDYPLLLELNRRSRQADGDPEPITLEAIADVLAHMDGLTREQGVILASVGDTPIGYSRLGWYSSRPQTRLYYQISFLIPEKRVLWPALIAENERRLRDVAARHAPVSEQYFQAWASVHQRDWKAVLEQAGYLVVRRFNNMLYTLGAAPDKPMPAGLEIRPVLPEHMRRIWEAQKEMNVGLFENVAEDWLDEKYPAWLANPANNPRFWQVAWAGDQVAGMVLARMDEQENEKQPGKHGYTEHIYVRPQWRGRGLASALIARSLQVLKEQGASEAELGVDAENESAAFRLYERLGYKTFSVDTWYRKQMDISK